MHISDTGELLQLLCYKMPNSLAGVAQLVECCPCTKRLRVRPWVEVHMEGPIDVFLPLSMSSGEDYINK